MREVLKGSVEQRLRETQVPSECNLKPRPLLNFPPSLHV